MTARRFLSLALLAVLIGLPGSWVAAYISGGSVNNPSFTGTAVFNGHIQMTGASARQLQFWGPNTTAVPGEIKFRDSSGEIGGITAYPTGSGPIRLEIYANDYNATENSWLRFMGRDLPNSKAVHISSGAALVVGGTVTVRGGGGASAYSLDLASGVNMRAGGLRFSDGSMLVTAPAGELNTFNSSKTFGAAPVAVTAVAGIEAGTFVATGSIVAGTNIIAAGSLRQGSVFNCSGGLTTSSNGTINGCAAGGETQTFTDPKTFTASVTVKGAAVAVSSIALGAVTTNPDYAIDMGPNGATRKSIALYSNGSGGAFYGLGFHENGYLEFWRNDALVMSLGATLAGIGTDPGVAPTAALQVNRTGGNIAEFTNGATKVMAVAAAGTVGVGTDSPCSTCTVHVLGNVNAKGSIRQGTALNCSTGVTSDADGKLDGCAVSSRKAKTRIKTAKADLSRFDQLRPVTYGLKRDKTNRPRLGFISEEVGALYPEAEIPAGADMTGLDTNALAAVLTLEVQDLRRRVAALEKRAPGSPAPAKPSPAGGAGPLAAAVAAGAAAGALAGKRKK